MKCLLPCIYKLCDGFLAAVNKAYKMFVRKPRNSGPEAGGEEETSQEGREDFHRRGRPHQGM